MVSLVQKTRELSYDIKHTRGENTPAVRLLDAYSDEKPIYTKIRTEILTVNFFTMLKLGSNQDILH